MRSNNKKQQETVGKSENSPIDGENFRTFIIAATTWLKTNQQMVNTLNVFPVPDGDTGTNMVLTMQAALAEIDKSTDMNLGKVVHNISQGALMGARGNSGVILSQIWRGFARAIDDFEFLDAHLFVKALVEARDTAYKGVVRPVEGTILTVAKDIAIEAEKAITETTNLLEIFKRTVEAAKESVKRTPELLPVLKQAGVVDAGGQGLFLIFEGILRHIQNLSLHTTETIVYPTVDFSDIEKHLDIEPGQDFEVIVDFQPYKPLDLNDFYAHLSEIGTSINIGEGDQLYRMHIHVSTENRYEPIDYIMDMGYISKVFIENLIESTENLGATKDEVIECSEIEPGQIAVIAVSPGRGISKIFASLGAAAIVGGGQTMNPSTEEILKSFEDMPTNKIIILPNNKNIFMAAKVASETSVKNVAVIPSISIPQGLNAMLQLYPDADFENAVQDMNEAIHELETGEITTATRNVEINGVKVNEGAVIALLNGKLICACEDLEEACLTLLRTAKTENLERITLFYGNDIEIEVVNQIVETLKTEYPEHEIEIHDGGQPHYHFIISIE
ncbi:MAG: DAK2 domain-containing protein [Anaerolineaceae bacterium]|nr:DAK2 domain-containing protein [Anaerolineaceae bacterium]